MRCVVNQRILAAWACRHQKYIPSPSSQLCAIGIKVEVYPVFSICQIKTIPGNVNKYRRRPRQTTARFKIPKIPLITDFEITSGGILTTVVPG